MSANIPLDNTLKPTTLENTSELWDEIGFHKPMAGFWFNVVYTIIGIIISSVVMGYFMSFFYPYPASSGYKDVATNLFGFLFLVFDVATGSVMGRFLPEVNIKNPEKMLHLIQYFIWYQMISGLIQTTIVSVYAIFFASQGNMAYVTWLMLIVSTTQYPGFLGVFSNVLDSLQQYHKAQTSRFIASTLVTRVVEIGFVYAGRVIGKQNPIIGEILGISMGAAIGSYVASFIAMVVSAYFFQQVMKTYGVRVRDCFRIQFTWAEVKTPLLYAVKTSVPSIISGLLNLINLYLWMDYVPQYTTILTLSYIGGSIGDVMDWFGAPNITSLVSESYMNKKTKLTQYYMGQLIRFQALLHGFFIPMIVVAYLVMPVAWAAMGMTYYLAGIIFIIPRMIKLVFAKYLAMPGQVIYGGDRPNYGLVVGVIQSLVNSLMIYLALVVWQIPIKSGLVGTALTMEFVLLPTDFIFGMIAFIYVDKTMVKVKIPWKQILIGLLLPSSICLGLVFIIKSFIFDPFYAQFGFFVAVIPSLLCVAGVLFFVYFPLTSFFGGWDNTNLEEFRKVAKMSGPSKIIVIPIYKIIERLSKKSKFHGKFEMSIEGVLEEAQDLLEIKRKNRDDFKAKIAKEQ